MGRKRTARKVILTAVLITTGICLGAWRISAAMKRARLSAALYHAVECGDLSNVEHLLNEGADPNVRTSYDAQPSILSVQWLRQTLFPTKQAPKRLPLTALMQATGWQDTKTIELLLSHHADINAVTSEGIPPEGYSTYGPEFEIGGYTALALACRRGSKEAAKVLLWHGANPNIARDDGKTPLYLASTRGASNDFDIQEGYDATCKRVEKENAEIVQILKQARARQ
jgi:ankyrin repeat protein